MPGPPICAKYGSIASGDRCRITAETIVQPKCDHVHILTDPVAEKGDAPWRDHAREGRVVTPHPEMVVFDAERPIRRETVFPADTEGTAPARVTCGVRPTPVRLLKTSKRLRVTAAPPFT